MKNLVAVVTGGGSGFGEGICGSFADQGARVVVADVDAPAGERVARSLRARGHEALFAAMDVSCSADWSRVIAAALARFGRIDAPKSDFGRDGKKLGRC